MTGSVVVGPVGGDGGVVALATPANPASDATPAATAKPRRRCLLRIMRSPLLHSRANRGPTQSRRTHALRAAEASPRTPHPRQYPSCTIVRHMMLLTVADRRRLRWTHP